MSVHNLKRNLQYSTSLIILQYLEYRIKTVRASASGTIRPCKI